MHGRYILLVFFNVVLHLQMIRFTSFNSFSHI